MVLYFCSERKKACTRFLNFYLSRAIICGNLTELTRVEIIFIDVNLKT